MTEQRPALVRRGLLLNYATITYNCLEAVVALFTGIGSGSVALTGFGIDSVIEVSASVAAQWRLRSDLDEERRERVELLTSRIIGVSFLALAAFVLVDSAQSLIQHERPERTLLGILLLISSVIVMPLLARAKSNIARRMESRALEAESRQTSLCAYLSAIALAGVALNSFLDLWWADPVAALAMVPIIAKEGVEGVRRQAHDPDCC
jgi:divalent metal cation (Fe/Co/Zn/Cd) transporter